MTETLEQIKKTIAEAHEQGIYNWNTATISTLLNTIESQKEEIEGLHDALEMLPPKDVEMHERTQFQIDKTVDRLLIESLQKENRELKSDVKALQKEYDRLGQEYSDLEDQAATWREESGN